jgi:hypothetical protein
MRTLPALLALALAGVGCGDGAPTPVEAGPPANAALIPTAPAPQPTPTPTPGATPVEEPIPATPGVPSDVATTSCGEPLPPAISRVDVKLHGTYSDSVLLDSTPLVGPDVEYCRQIGFTDGRSFCPVRPEGHPERVACEAARVGRASDTGRYGPTWTAAGHACHGPDGGIACLNHPDNQYLVIAYGTGPFRACTASGVCGELTLP